MYIYIYILKATASAADLWDWWMSWFSDDRLLVLCARFGTSVHDTIAILEAFDVFLTIRQHNRDAPKVSLALTFCFDIYWLGKEDGQVYFMGTQLACHSSPLMVCFGWLSRLDFISSTWSMTPLACLGPGKIATRAKSRRCSWSGWRGPGAGLKEMAPWAAAPNAKGSESLECKVD